jgi:hypothetical protein
MRKLAAYPRQNQIARALNEIGQLEKTVFILELLLDPQLRRRQERGLNDGEAVNSASRAIFVGQRGEFRDRAYLPGPGPSGQLPAPVGGRHWLPKSYWSPSRRFCSSRAARWPR